MEGEVEMTGSLTDDRLLLLLCYLPSAQRAVTSSAQAPAQLRRRQRPALRLHLSGIHWCILASKHKQADLLRAAPGSCPAQNLATSLQIPNCFQIEVPHPAISV